MLRHISYAIDMLQLLYAPFAMNWYVLKFPICHWYAPEHLVRYWYAPITLCSICYELIYSEMSYLPLKCSGSSRTLLICSNYSMLHLLWIKYVFNDMIHMILYLMRWYLWISWILSCIVISCLFETVPSHAIYALLLAELFLAHSVVI